jgi:hypothetical protein
MTLAINFDEVINLAGASASGTTASGTTASGTTASSAALF